MKKLLSLLAIIIICYSCEKDKPYNSMNLTGNWSWIISCGGFAGCSTPESSHVNINLVFTADSICKVYRNGSLSSSYSYKVYKTISAETNETVNILEYNDMSQEFTVKNDTLRLNSFGVFSSTFKRNW